MHMQQSRRIQSAPDLYDGSSIPSMVSRSAERGLANWPAMRPIFTTGTPPPNIATTAICSMTLKESLILLALNCEKLSAQSPPATKVAVL